MSKQSSNQPQNETDGWEWFQGDPTLKNKGTYGDQTIKHAFARCFSSREGQEVLAHLKTLTLERTLGPNASDSILRHLEGQRQLVAYIDNQIKQGHTTQT